MDKRRIFLDPYETGDELGWVMVIVAAPTGVVYEHQGGGYSCLQYEQEGYLIPLFGLGLDERLKRIFAEELRGHGTMGVELTDRLLDRLRAAVGEFAVHGAANQDDRFPAPLVLDEARRGEIDEAWVPVVTPDGPGVLVWGNSD